MRYEKDMPAFGYILIQTARFFRPWAVDECPKKWDNICVAVIL